MKEVDLRVKINAELQWIRPPENKCQEILREQANTKIAYLASKLEVATKLILAEMVAISFDE